MRQHEEEFLKDLFIVIVLYKSHVTESRTIQSISQALQIHQYNTRPRVLLYDNSPFPVDASSLDQCRLVFDLTYLHDETNPGVSKAYNVAATMAAAEEKSWLLFFDQDTVVTDDVFKSYFHSGIAKYAGVHLFCPFLKSGDRIYSPCKYYFKRGFFWKDLEPGKHNLKNRSLLNSGILISRVSFEKTQGFNEKVKLYFSDFEFIDRYRKHYTQFCVVESTFLHELSDNVFKEREKAISRFYYYVEGARESVKSNADWLIFFVTVGLRSIKLAIRFRNYDFVRVFIKTFM